MKPSTPAWCRKARPVTVMCPVTPDVVDSLKATLRGLPHDLEKKDSPLLLLTPVEVVRAVLPEWTERGDGAFLMTTGHTAAQPRPYMSGVGPLMARNRDLVQQLGVVRVRFSRAKGRNQSFMVGTPRDTNCGRQGHVAGG